MKKLLLLFPGIIFFIGCSSKPEPIDTNDVIAITIESNRNVREISHFDLRLKDRNEISPICKAINSSEKYARKFVAEYYIKIRYKDGREQLVLCNGNHLKINGLTYEMERKLSDVLTDVLNEDSIKAINL